MSTGRNIDGELVQWGERLFYPSNRIVKSDPLPHLQVRATQIRGRIAALVRRAPQVIVKTTSGGKGMNTIAGHLRYITKSGCLSFEDDRGTVREGKDALRDLLDQWRYCGTFIADAGHRREALNITLAMRAGTDAELVRNAAREFAQIELAEHRYVMVLHIHQTSPHVHLCTKVESATGRRLHPGLGDLNRWRETFAERLRGWGVDADATRKAMRGATRNFESLWRLKAKDEGRLRHPVSPTKTGPAYQRSCAEAVTCWAQIMKALSHSDRADDRRLATHVVDFVARTPFITEILGKDPEALREVRQYLAAHPQRQPVATPERSGPERTHGTRVRPDPEWTR